jgi:hypothetical protein
MSSRRRIVELLEQLELYRTRYGDVDVPGQVDRLNAAGSAWPR